MEMFCILPVPMLACWFWYHTIVLQGVTIGISWVNGTRELSMLFLATAYKPQIFPNKMFKFLKTYICSLSDQVSINSISICQVLTLNNYS